MVFFKGDRKQNKEGGNAWKQYVKEHVAGDTIYTYFLGNLAVSKCFIWQYGILQRRQKAKQGGGQRMETVRKGTRGGRHNLHIFFGKSSSEQVLHMAIWYSSKETESKTRRGATHGNST